MVQTEIQLNRARFLANCIVSQHMYPMPDGCENVNIKDIPLDKIPMFYELFGILVQRREIHDTISALDRRGLELGNHLYYANRFEHRIYRYPKPEPKVVVKRVEITIREVNNDR